MGTVSRIEFSSKQRGKMCTGQRQERNMMNSNKKNFSIAKNKNVAKCDTK